MTRPTFSSISWTRRGPLVLPDPEFPCSLSLWAGGGLDLPQGASHYGFVVEGTAQLSCASGTFELKSGMYFALPGPGMLTGPGRGIVVARPAQRCLFSLGGPVEERGRLRYVDGCTDSLLIAPAVLGDPCLNLLHLPPGTRQTAHTHPTVRVGVIASGRGRCVTPLGEVPLEPGQVFVIAPGGEHCFHTDDQALRVIAYHPDSDTGPSDGDHPMVNRTYVDGRSASELSSIRTRGPLGGRP